MKSFVTKRGFDERERESLSAMDLVFVQVLFNEWRISSKTEDYALRRFPSVSHCSPCLSPDLSHTQASKALPAPASAILSTATPVALSIFSAIAFTESLMLTSFTSVFSHKSIFPLPTATRIPFPFSSCDGNDSVGEKEIIGFHVSILRDLYTNNARDETKTEGQLTQHRVSLASCVPLAPPPAVALSIIVAIPNIAAMQPESDAESDPSAPSCGVGKLSVKNDQ